MAQNAPWGLKILKFSGGGHPDPLQWEGAPPSHTYPNLAPHAKMVVLPPSLVPAIDTFVPATSNLNKNPGMEQNEVTSTGLNDLRTFTSHPTHTNMSHIPLSLSAYSFELLCFKKKLHPHHCFQYHWWATKSDCYLVREFGYFCPLNWSNWSLGLFRTLDFEKRSVG